MQPSDGHCEDLARLLGATREEEIDCDEMLHRVGAYLEALRKDRDGAKTESLRRVAQHLEICPECREEFEALIRAEGLDPENLLGQ